VFAVTIPGGVRASGRRVLVAGATGTIGRATVRALVRRGHEVVCFVRRAGARPAGAAADAFPPGVRVRAGDVGDPASVAREGFAGERFDAVVSCLASRTGAPDDAWAVDHRAHAHLLAAARAAGVGQFVLLSAMCVQKPRLAFQHAKLAFERELVASGVAYSIVRPTAYFKSLSGQVARVRRGKPFLVFGDGRLTACKPISDGDLAEYLVGCLEDPARRDRVLPVGGPGPAITPRQQGELLFALLGRRPRFAHVPVRLLDGVAGALGALAHALPARLAGRVAAKAEFARIGRYYATESMLTWDEGAGRYDPDATPEFGRDTLAEHYRRLLAGEAEAGLGAHAVF
jgi:divinyl chlorophyllide a 8-vinyl-reductase